MEMETRSALDQHVRALVAALGDDAGLPGLSLAEDDAVELTFEETDFVLTFEEEAKALFISTVIEKLPAPLDREAMALLAQADAVLFSHEMSSLVYAPEEQKIFQLFRIAAAELSREHFLSWVRRSLETIETTREAVREALTAPTKELRSDEEQLFIRP